MASPPNPSASSISVNDGKSLADAPDAVLIRSRVQIGNIVIPKSVNPEHIVSTFDVFDFELSELARRLGADPRILDFTG